MAKSINPLHLLVIKERSVAVPFWESRLPLHSQNPNIQISQRKLPLRSRNVKPETWKILNSQCTNLITFLKLICPHGWLQNCWDNIWYLTAKAVVSHFFHASLLQKGPDSHHFIIFPRFYRQPEGMLDPQFVCLDPLISKLRVVSNDMHLDI